MPESWVALSDDQTKVNDADGQDILPRSTFVLELVLPLTGPVVLLDHAVADAMNGRQTGFSLFHDPERGLILMQRQGKRMLRHILPAPITGDSGLVRVTYHWDAVIQHSQLSVDRMNGTAVAHAQGTEAMMWSVADMIAICGQGQRHPSVLWCGVTTHAAPPTPLPWIGQRTPVDTPSGPVAAGLLRRGDLVTTLDDGPRRLQRVRHIRVPGLGAFAPVLLRAPYFGLTQDLLVSSRQPICLQGTSVEYLFGEDRVLAEAQHMEDGIAAFVDNRRSVVTGVCLQLDGPALMTADSCILLTDASRNTSLPARLLHRFEVTPLLAMQARSGLRPVA